MGVLTAKASRLTASHKTILAIALAVSGCGADHADSSAPGARSGLRAGVSSPHAGVRTVSTKGSPSFSFDLPRGWENHGLAQAGHRWRSNTLLTSFHAARRNLNVCPPQRHAVVAHARNGDAAIWIFSYGPALRQGRSMSFPRRRHFDLSRSQLSRYECTGRGYRLTFRRNGWKVQAQIAVRGGRLSPVVRRQAEAILGSLRVRSGRAGSSQRHDQADGVSARLPAAWHLDHQQLTQLAEPSQVFVASSFRLHQRKPDSNCSPRTAVREMGDGSFVFLIEDHGVRPSGRWWYKPRPRRFTFASSEYVGHECFGNAYEWNFRDRGRFFKALIYLDPKHTPTATQSAALRVLDSIRFRRATPVGSGLRSTARSAGAN